MGSQTQVFNIFPGRCGSGPSRRLLLCNARDAGTLRQQAYPAGECNVKDAVYKVTEVVGTSTKGIEDAIQRAISRTAKTVHHIRWFERSEEHTSELQSLMRISYAVFCLKKKKKNTQVPNKLLCKSRTI